MLLKLFSRRKQSFANVAYPKRIFDVLRDRVRDQFPCGLVPVSLDAVRPMEKPFNPLRLRSS